MRTILMTLFFVLLLSGCTFVSFSANPTTTTPNSMPRLDPSPTPSESTLPLTCQVTDLNVYINEMDGYCFAYPTNFTLGDQPSDKPDVRGPAVDDSVEPIHAMLTVEFAPASGVSLREQAEAYLKEFSAADPATYKWTQVFVGSEAGLMVEPVPAMLSYRIVFVQHNGNLFRLMYWPVDIPEAQSDLNDLTQTTLGSFSFTK
jgi:hypothetical protein